MRQKKIRKKNKEKKIFGEQNKKINQVKRSFGQK